MGACSRPRAHEGFQIAGVDLARGDASRGADKRCDLLAPGHVGTANDGDLPYSGVPEDRPCFVSSARSADPLTAAGLALPQRAVIEFDAADGGPVPTLLVAVTVNV